MDPKFYLRILTDLISSEIRDISLFEVKLGKVCIPSRIPSLRQSIRLFGQCRVILHFHRKFQPLAKEPCLEGFIDQRGDIISQMWTHIPVYAVKSFDLFRIMLLIVPIKMGFPLFSSDALPDVGGNIVPDIW